MLMGRSGPPESQHGYEEIRETIYSILRKSGGNGGGQYVNLRHTLASNLEALDSGRQSGYDPRAELSVHDANIYQEIFWTLFREGIITLGSDDLNPNFPFYRITEYGRKLLSSSESPYFFTDVTDYERILLAGIPSIDPITMLYVKEAVQTFKIGAVLASSVMIGVAAEHTFNLLVDQVEANSTWAPKFTKVTKETRILPRLNEFRKVLDAHISVLPPEIKEDLDTRFTGIVSLIRTFRNDAGHPTGKIVDREQAFINLQLFVPYASKLYQLIDFYRI